MKKINKKNITLLLIICIFFIIFLIFFYISLSFINFKPTLKYVFSSSSNEIFLKNKDFYKFTPNSSFNIDAIYLHDNKSNKIFSYNFNSNNYGFIQKNDLRENKKSTVFIGDSFTQGFGYKSWVDDIKLNTYQDSQIINAGIMSTGFVDWFYHLRFINNNFIVENTFILFISDDIYRKQFLPSNQVLNCIKFSVGCNIFSSFVGSGYDLNRKYNLIDYISLLYRYIAFNFFIKQGRFQNNIAALHGIINDNSRNNLIFFHIPMFQEVILNHYDVNINEIVKIIESRGINYVSLLDKCSFTIEDYYQIDHHMNSIGYEKLKICIENYLNQLNNRM